MDAHPSAPPALRRALGWPALTFDAVGLILGAGIYSVIGLAAGTAGEGLWWSFVVASAAALLTGLSYVELATMHPVAGAEYVYLREAFPTRRWAPPLVGWMLVASGAATGAAVALAFAETLRLFVDWPPTAVAGALLLAATAINLVGVRESSRFNVLFTLVEVGGLVLFIALGASAEGFGDALAVAPGAGLLPAAALVFFAYMGFEGVANLAEEARDPARDLPRAVLLSLAITTALYVLAALAAVALLPAATLAESPAPLADAAARATPRAAGVLAGIGLFATANTALLQLLVSSRTLLAMARGGDAPRALARLSPARRTPTVASVALLGGSLVLVPLGDLRLAAGVASLSALVAFGAVHASLIALRYRRPDLPRPFRVVGSIGRFPVLPAVGLATVLVLVAQLEAAAWAVGGACAAAALVLGARRGARDRRAN